MYLVHLGHGDIVCAAAHGNRNVHAACAKGKHAQTACGRGMTVGAYEGLAGYAKTLQMYLMAYAVSGAGKVHAVL